MGILINRIPGSGSRILISSLPGSSLGTHVESLGKSTSVLKALPGKLDIKRHSPSILHISSNNNIYTPTLPRLVRKQFQS